MLIAIGAATLVAGALPAVAEGRAGPQVPLALAQTEEPNTEAQPPAPESEEATAVEAPREGEKTAGEGATGGQEGEASGNGEGPPAEEPPAEEETESGTTNQEGPPTKAPQRHKRSGSHKGTPRRSGQRSGKGAPVRRLTVTAHGAQGKPFPLGQLVILLEAKKRLLLAVTVVKGGALPAKGAAKRVAGPFLLIATKGTNHLHLPARKRLAPGRYRLEVQQLNGHWTRTVAVALP